MEKERERETKERQSRRPHEINQSMGLGVGGHRTTRGQQWLHPGAKESELKERNGPGRELGDKE
jgi:hypothetical protein